MASLSNALDLQSSSAPRSLCIFEAPEAFAAQSSRSVNQGFSNSNNPFEQRRNFNQSSNPFDNAARALSPSGSNNANSWNKQDSAKYAIVFGTEGGALHYRTYPHGSLGVGDVSGRRGAGGAGGLSSFDPSREAKILPLGLDNRVSTARSNASVGSRTPPLHQPIDLPNAVSGAIVGMIQAKYENKSDKYSSNSTNSPIPFETFLLLVDDNRGSAPSSSSAPGTYAAHLVSLHLNQSPTASSYTPKLSNVNTFSKLNINLPRMSAAAYHPNCGFVYAAGTSILSLGNATMKDIYTAALSANSNSGYLRSQKTSLHPAFINMSSITYKCNNVLPSNARSGGQDALALVCQGYAAVVSVNSTFYAVASTLPSNNPNSNISPPSAPKYKNDKKKKNPNPKDLITPSGVAVKLLSLNQSSVHPVVIIEINTSTSISNQTTNGNIISSNLFLASGRECTVLEMHYSPSLIKSATSDNQQVITPFPPRHGNITFPSPILGATSTLVPSSRLRAEKYSSSKIHSAGSFFLLAILTADGSIHMRSPICINVPLSVLTVGSRPNNFFALKEFPKVKLDDGSSGNGGSGNGSRGKKVLKTGLLAVGYSGEAAVVLCREDSSQEQADRIMRLAIDAFGMDSFPRKELAEALNCSFSAASHVGPEPTSHSRSILRQYLEVALGLTNEIHGEHLFLPASDDSEYDDVEEVQIIPRGAFDALDLNESSPSPSKSSIKTQASPFYITCTALLCLVCAKIPNAKLANRASKACAARIKITSYSNFPPPVLKVCETIVEHLLNFASKSVSLLQQSPLKIESLSKSSQKESNMEFTEASLWLLRSCGRHEEAISVFQERMSVVREDSSLTSFPNSSSLWSPADYESYIAAHLSELYSSDDENCTKLALVSSATKKLLEENPVLGLSVFMSGHPRNTQEWIDFHGDPLGTKTACTLVSMVVELLKGLEPHVSQASLPDKVVQSQDIQGDSNEGENLLALDSGRALAVTYLECVVGISSGKPMSGAGEVGEIDALELLPTADGVEEHVEGLHDELVYLLLEGVISEMKGDEDETKGVDIFESKTKLGIVYRNKLRRMLSWPMAKYRTDRVLDSLPSSFLREHALLLGRLGKHEEALKILYCDMNDLDLALEYCDTRYERQIQQEQIRQKRQAQVGFSSRNYSSDEAECAYLPLVKVALNSSTSSSPDHRGTAAAIQVLALRRHAIDRGAALRLLPDVLPMSAVARPFLIPALVDSESQVRRLTVTASLLRAKYISLKHALTEAQIKSQADLTSIPALQSLNLGSPFPLRSSKPYKARSSSATSSTFPDVTITKHFFPQHMIIQVQVRNSAPALQGRTLGDVAFFVAESSDEAILPSNNVPIQTLPFNTTGCAWCALGAFPARLDGIAILTCELRYTVLSVDAATGAPLHFSGSGVGSKGRTYVEELQDVEVRSRDFEAMF